MQRYGEAVLVEVPEPAEDELGLGTGVYEHDGGTVRPDRVVDFGKRVDRHMARPGHRPAHAGNGDFGRDAPAADHDFHIRLASGAGRKPAGQIVPVRDRRRQGGPSGAGRHAAEPRQAEREQVAALVVGERMQLVDDDTAEGAEQGRRVGPGEHQRQRFGRRHQHLRRLPALPFALPLRRVAGARLHADIEAHFRDRGFEIAVDIDGQRLQRRDIEGMQSGARRRRKLSDAGQEAGQRLAAAGRRHQQCRAPGRGRAPHRQLVCIGPPAARPEPAPNNGGLRDPRACLHAAALPSAGPNGP